MCAGRGDRGADWNRRDAVPNREKCLLTRHRLSHQPGLPCLSVRHDGRFSPSTRRSTTKHDGTSVGRTTTCELHRFGTQCLAPPLASNLSADYPPSVSEPLAQRLLAGPVCPV